MVTFVTLWHPLKGNVIKPISTSTRSKQSAVASSFQTLTVKLKHEEHSKRDEEPKVLVVFPEGQEMQAGAPELGWYVPAPHCEHAVAPKYFENVPAAQVEQTEEVVLP
jgi:uncharacterized protein YcnI